MNRRNGSPEARWVNEAARRFGNDIADGLQLGATEANQVWARAKKALIILAYISGISINQIETNFTSNARYYGVGADITGPPTTRGTGYVPSTNLWGIAYPAFAPDPDAMAALFQQMEIGIPADILDLMSAPGGTQSRRMPFATPSRYTNGQRALANARGSVASAAFCADA
jgi:hypothetical protein